MNHEHDISGGQQASMRQRALAYSFLLLGLLLLVLLLALLVAAWHTFTQTSGLLIQVLLLTFMIAIPVALVGLGAFKGYLAWLRIQERRQALRHADEQHAVEQYLARTLIPADPNGNRPVVVGIPPQQLTVLPSGNFAQNVPHTYAPRWEYRDTGTQVREEPGSAPAQLPAPQVRSLTMEEVLSLLKPNALEVCLGVSATTGTPFIMPLLKGVHYKFLGGSGFGKSCEAAALLEMATQANDPAHLMIALLDLEHKTSQVFEHLPHVAELAVGRRYVPCVATSADEVAEQLGYLKRELDRRARLSEGELRRERFLLIYVEEFLSLRYEVEDKLKAQMLADFTVLAIRGRKYGMYLLACAQTDYADESLREAKNQFKVKGAFNLEPNAARAAGFVRHDLIKQNYIAQVPGQFVLETGGCMDLMLAPQYDLQQKLERVARSCVQEPFGTRSATHLPPPLRLLNSDRTRSEQALNTSPNTAEQAWQGKLDQVRGLRERGWQKIAIIEKVWNAKRGGSKAYQQAEAEYEQIVQQLEGREHEGS